VRNEFNLESKQTVGVEFGPRDVTIENKVIRIQVWDTAGQERFHSITSGFYRNAAGVFLVYDISKADSFEDISVWRSLLDLLIEMA
jgi:small GTP-binding protein